MAGQEITVNYARLRKVGNSFVITVPKRYVVKNGLKVGDELTINISPA
jgi:antitoxin component of MazEF toxin-antitoxin module